MPQIAGPVVRDVGGDGIRRKEGDEAQAQFPPRNGRWRAAVAARSHAIGSPSHARQNEGDRKQREQGVRLVLGGDRQGHAHAEEDIVSRLAALEEPHVEDAPEHEPEEVGNVQVRRVRVVDEHRAQRQDQRSEYPSNASEEPLGDEIGQTNDRGAHGHAHRPCDQYEESQGGHRILQTVGPAVREMRQGDLSRQEEVSENRSVGRVQEHEMEGGVFLGTRPSREGPLRVDQRAHGGDLVGPPGDHVLLVPGLLASRGLHGSHVRGLQCDGAGQG